MGIVPMPAGCGTHRNNRAKEKHMTSMRGQLLATAAGLVLAVALARTVASADQLLTGAITGPTGQKLEGVQVSAKKEGATITTSVYTDLNGEYFFPPLAEGKYNVLAQALSFQNAKGSVDLSAGRHQEFM